MLPKIIYICHIQLHKATCSFVNHFWATDSPRSVHPTPNNPREYNKHLHEEMEIVLIDQLLPVEGEPKRKSLARLRKLEGEWQAKLQTYEPQGLNTREEWKP